MSGGTTRGSSDLFAPAGGGWVTHDGDAYSCQVFLFKDTNGFTATAATIPGISVQGGTPQEVLDRITLALSDVIRRSKAGGGEIPWIESPTAPTGASIKWVIARL